MSINNQRLRTLSRGVTTKFNVGRDHFDITNLPEVPCPICQSRSFATVAFRFDSGRLVACNDCGHIFLNPTFTDEMLVEIYRTYHDSGEERSEMEIIEAWFNTPGGQYQ